MTLAHSVFEAYAKTLSGNPMPQEEGKGCLFTHTWCWAFGGWGQGSLHAPRQLLVSNSSTEEAVSSPIHTEANWWPCRLPVRGKVCKRDVLVRFYKLGGVPVECKGKRGPLYLRKSANVSQVVVLGLGLER